MTIATLDQLIAAMPGQHRHFNKTGFSSGTAYSWWTLWNSNGNPGIPGTPPSGAGEIPTNANAGNFFSLTPPTPPAQSFLAQMDVQGVRGGMFLYVDRLWHASGLVANIATPQVVNSLPLTRPDANGVGAELWLEVFVNVVPSTGNHTVTVAYTNSDGVAKTTSIQLPSSSVVVAYAQPIPLAAGDKGIQSVQSVTFDAAGSAAGNVGLAIVRRFGAIIASQAQITADRDALALGMPRVYDGACFSLFMLSDSTNTGAISGGIQVVQG